MMSFDDERLNVLKRIVSDEVPIEKIVRSLEKYPYACRVCLSFDRELATNRPSGSESAACDTRNRL